MTTETCQRLPTEVPTALSLGALAYALEHPSWAPRGLPAVLPTVSTTDLPRPGLEHDLVQPQHEPTYIPVVPPRSSTAYAPAGPPGLRNARSRVVPRTCPDPCTGPPPGGLHGVLRRPVPYCPQYRPQTVHIEPTEWPVLLEKRGETRNG